MIWGLFGPGLFRISIFGFRILFRLAFLRLCSGQAWRDKFFWSRSVQHFQGKYLKMAITGARVLIVDDDPASRRLLEVRLRPLECDVATAGNGEQALTAIRKDAPDLVLLDLQMPKMGGIEVLRALRKEKSMFRL